MQIEIRTSTGKNWHGVWVEAEATDTPGLAVHNGSKGWNVTHIASGYRVGDFWRTRQQALLAARLLGQLRIDWMLPGTDDEMTERMKGAGVITERTSEIIRSIVEEKTKRTCWEEDDGF